MAEALALLHVEYYMSGITAEELAHLLRGRGTGSCRRWLALRLEGQQLLWVGIQGPVQRMVLLLYSLPRLPQVRQRGLEAMKVEPATPPTAWQGTPACEHLQGSRPNVQLRDAAVFRSQGLAIEQQTVVAQCLHHPEVWLGFRQDQGEAPDVYIEVLSEQGPQVDASAV